MKNVMHQAALTLFGIFALLVMLLGFGPVANGATNLYYACKTPGMEGKTTEDGCTLKTWLPSSEPSSFATCEADPCTFLNGAKWRSLASLAPGMRVYRCLADIPANVVTTNGTSQCPVAQRAWFPFAGAPTVRKGNITVAWNAPTTNIDDTPITNLGGFRIYRRPPNEAEWSPSVVLITSPALRRYVLEDIPATQTCFALTAMSTANIESAKTDAVCATPQSAAGDVVVTIYVGTPPAP